MQRFDLKHTAMILIDHQVGTITNVQGPLMPELQAIAPEAFAARVKRKGVVNAWDDEDFANACRNTGKRNLVMAGVPLTSTNAIIAQWVKNWEPPAGAIDLNHAASWIPRKRAVVVRLVCPRRSCIASRFPVLRYVKAGLVRRNDWVP